MKNLRIIFVFILCLPLSGCVMVGAYVDRPLGDSDIQKIKGLEISVKPVKAEDYGYVGFQITTRCTAMPEMTGINWEKSYFIRNQKNAGRFVKLGIHNQYLTYEGYPPVENFPSYEILSLPAKYSRAIYPEVVYNRKPVNKVIRPKYLRSGQIGVHLVVFVGQQEEQSLDFIFNIKYNRQIINLFNIRS